MRFRHVVICVFVLLLGIGFVASGQQSAPTTTRTDVRVASKHLYTLWARDTLTGSDLNLVVARTVADGSNAADVMKSLVTVKDKGGLITSIAGVAAPKGYYWALYVNGKYATKGIGGYVVDAGILIDWRMDKIQNYDRGNKK